MDTPRVRCLILGCGNTLRGDDGVGPLLCAWAEERFAGEPGVRAMASHQWSPEMAEDVAAADTVLFVDCSLDQAPGQVLLRELTAVPLKPGLVTHHLGAAELLRVAQDLYGAQPRRACLLTIGAGSIELGEELSPSIRAALPDAQALLELTVRQLLR
ncbi:MAG TPA: hydrogenase maturation protease [Terracidiphilus sp.]|nr:hydrogenase maturation protease [Terracidiphilus sp.]